ncbi:MAG: sugar phosphate isomerase/epimerase [Clostridia bacterium]|nr:sugar phosphate isomerase/epimerase [Clostridia bacterium]
MENIKIFAFADEASEDFEGQITAMLDNKLNGIEIRGVDGVNISDISMEKAKEIKTKLDNNNLSVWSIGSPIGKIGLDDDINPHLDKLKRTMEIADILNCELIRMFSFYIPKGVSADNCRGEVIDKVGKLLETAKGSGIYLCHENEKGIYGDTAERCLDLLKTFPELKGVFDPANFVQCGVDTAKAWNLLKDYIYYMHIKDSKWDCCVVPAGQGDGNLKYVVGEYLKKGGRCFTMEPHLAYFKGLAALEREGGKSEIASSVSSEKKLFDLACDTFKKLLLEV